MFFLLINGDSDISLRRLKIMIVKLINFLKSSELGTFEWWISG